jgi:hypothetical protein
MFERLKLFLARAALVAASFAASSLIMLAIGSAFHGASSEPWLRDSPHARAAAERCAVYAARQARHQCVRAAVMEARARDAGAAQLAAAERRGASEPGP